MTDLDHALDAAAAITGAFAVALVDHDSGLTLGSRGGSAQFDLDVAAPGNSEVVRAKLQVMESLGLRETLEDILITLGTQYHLIRPIRGRSEDQLFFYLALDRAQANLAVARRDLRMITSRFHLDDPSAAPRPLADQAPSPVPVDADPDVRVGAAVIAGVGAVPEIPVGQDGPHLPRVPDPQRVRSVPSVGVRGSRRRVPRLLRRLRAAGVTAERIAM